MKSLTFLCLTLCIAQVFSLDCITKTAHGSSTTVPLGGAQILAFKGVKPQIKFVAAPLGSAPAIKVVGSSVAVHTHVAKGSKGPFLEVLSDKCVASPPPPPPSPLPTKAPVPAGKKEVAVVEVKVTLGGYTKATFGTNEQTAFKKGIATVASVTADKVNITAIADTTRRHLLAGSVTVDFEIEAKDVAAATAAGDAVKKADLKTALVTAGLSKTESTAVTVSVAKTKIVDIATSSPPPNVVASAASRTRGSTSFAIMAPLALASLRVSPLAATLLAIIAVGGNMPYAAAQTCTDASAVEVHMDVKAADAIVSDAWKSNHSCPPESFWWKHHKDVHGGYEGCVSEIGLIPCGTNGFTGMGQTQGGKDVKLAVKWDASTSKCIKSNYTIADEYLYIRGGLPHDGPELKKRSGIHPVVTFPLLRSPYPRYINAEDDTDDNEDMKAALKEFMVYQEAFTVDQLQAYDVVGTEGAEQGMVTIHAAKALEIARTTCNRNIYVLVEAPSYGYTTSRINQMVNSYKSSFLTTHLNWVNATGNATTVNVTCPSDDVSVTMVGWFPGTGYPSRAATPYGIDVIATSADLHSPWFESMVFPENPSGKVKTQNIPAAANRLVCDGCYLYPVYFGSGYTKGKATGAPASYYSGDMTEGYYIPKDKMPSCDSWAFSITKMYSASVRAGTVMFKKDNESYRDIAKRWSPLSEGSYSEWSWWGQMQIWQMLMSKPLYDPTSWMGAYAKLQDEKSQALVDGFKDCPVIDYLNPKSTAYSWFKYKPGYHTRASSTPNFWMHTLNIFSFDYSWGFRGADPSTYYGVGYTVYDFQRLHLYRDLSVYKEVGRRAKIVCGGGKLPGMMSIAEWAAAAGHTNFTNGTSVFSGRKLSAAAAASSAADGVGYFDTSHINHADPETIHLAHQSEAEKKYHNQLHREHLKYQAVVDACMAKDDTVSTDCLFDGLDELKHREKTFSPVASQIAPIVDEPDA